MGVRKIIERGDAVLGKKCHPVTVFDQRLHDLIDDMRETLEQAHGYGLAAPQVGILRRVVLVTSSEGEILELVNPEIIATDGEQEGFEGCLSVPGLYGWVRRPYYAKVRAQDRFGNAFEAEDVEMSARCFCHEIEHLDGHLFTERVEGDLFTEKELREMEEEQLREEEKQRKKGKKGGR